MTLTQSKLLTKSIWVINMMRMAILSLATEMQLTSQIYLPLMLKQVRYISMAK